MGSGPNRPSNCIEEVHYGDQIIVLRISHAGGDSQVYLRYSGCNHHGFDDGTSMHRLTRAGVGNFFVAGVEISGYSSELSDVFARR